jgi:hypothetical protein
MIREFNPVTSRIRALAAGTAVVATAGIAWSVLALVRHYDDEFLQVVRAQSAVATMHAKAPAPVAAGTDARSQSGFIAHG